MVAKRKVYSGRGNGKIGALSRALDRLKAAPLRPVISRESEAELNFSSALASLALNSASTLVDIEKKLYGLDIVIDAYNRGEYETCKYIFPECGVDAEGCLKRGIYIALRSNQTDLDNKIRRFEKSLGEVRDLGCREFEPSDYTGKIKGRIDSLKDKSNAVKELLDIIEMTVDMSGYTIS